jgi:uncharacterized membrane protein
MRLAALALIALIALLHFYIAWFEMGVSETLCMRLSPCSFDGSLIEPFWV